MFDFLPPYGKKLVIIYKITYYSRFRTRHSISVLHVLFGVFEHCQYSTVNQRITVFDFLPPYGTILFPYIKSRITVDSEHDILSVFYVCYLVYLNIVSIQL